MIGRRLLGLAAFGAVMLAGSLAQAETYTLLATPKTVAWGYYSATAKPVLTIKSGDTVVFHTLLTNSPAGLAKAGVPDDQIEQSLKDVVKEVTDKGPGGHILTGPVYIEGAEPGDTIEIRIKKIDLAIPYAYNAFRYGAGFQTEEFPYARMKIIPLDREKMIGHFGPGIELPLRPFFGSMGVAPPPAIGRYDSAPPTFIGGNMDNKELVAGTTLYLPVFCTGCAVRDRRRARGAGERRERHHRHRDLPRRHAGVRAAQEDRPNLSPRRDAHPLHRHGL